MKWLYVLAVAIAAITGLPAATAADLNDKTAALVDQALESDLRSDADRARDKNRSAKKTLAFFGLERRMRVAELFPGGGWYTKLLVPVLKEKGEYYAIGGLGKALGFGEILANTRKLPGMKDLKIIDVSDALEKTARRGVLDAKTFPLDVENLDLVLTFRNLHNLTPGARMAFYKAAYRALKPGGRLGAIDHTRRHMERENEENWRRLDPVVAIREATQAGFKLIDHSTLHARADDELRYEVGRRSVTGNTDRFTLLFEK